jgi:cell division septation protein DedD
MDNSMVKRGIGAIVLAIIAALLLGYLLKDKSRERQEVVDMKLPGAPELNIPSLSEATEKVTDSAASLIDEAKDKVVKSGSAVVASASGTFNDLSDSASNSINSATDAVTNKANTAIKTATTGNPGFSFRPPSQNEEQVVIDNVSSSELTRKEASNPELTTNTVVASTAATAPNAPNAPIAPKPYKPVIESEPEKKLVNTQRKLTESAPKPTKPVAPVSQSNNSGKYSIQLLATSSQSRANKLAETMRSEGYSMFITQTTSNNKILYRVRAGGHDDRAAALKAQEVMKRRYQKNFFVQNSLVISN